MTTRSFAIRFGADGTEVHRVLEDTGRKGTAAYGAIGAAANDAAAQGVSAAERQQRAWARTAAALTEAERQRQANAANDKLLGVLPVDKGAAQFRKSGIEEAFAAEERSALRTYGALEKIALAAADYDARAQKLRATLDPLHAAQVRYDAELAGATGLLNAGAISADTFALAQQRARAQLDQTTGALDRQAAAPTWLAMEKIAAAAGDLQVRTERLKAALDPLYGAQARYDDELKEANALLQAGTISTDTYARAQANARAQLEQTTQAIGKQGGRSRQEVASRLNLARQGADVLVTGAMGMNPLMIAIQQGPQILDAMSTSGLKVSRSLLLAGGSAGVLVAALGVAAKLYLDAEDGALKLERAATGVGRAAGLSGEQVGQLAKTAAEAGEISVAAAEKQAVAYLSTGKIGGEVLGGLIEIGKDVAATTGRDLPAANKLLADSFADPVRGMQMLAEAQIYVDDKTRQHVESLVRQGQLFEAQKVLLPEVRALLIDHGDTVGEIASQWDAVRREISDATDALGKFLYMDASERLEVLQRRKSQGRRPLIDTGADEALDAEIAELSKRVNGPKWDAFRARIKSEQGRIEDGARARVDRGNPEGRQRRELQDLVAGLKADAANPRLSPELRGEATESLTRAQKALAELGKEKAKGISAAERHAQALAREGEALEANARGALAMADAYLHSGESALVAEARRVASTKAAKNGADVELRTRQQLNLMAAEQALAGAKVARGLFEQAEAQSVLNTAVGDGTMTVEAAAEALQLDAVLRPIVTAAASAEGAAKTKLLAVVEALTNAQRSSNAETARTTVLQETAAARDEAAALAYERSLVGRLRGEAQAVALARRAEVERQGKLPAGALPAGEARDRLDAEERRVRERFALDRAQWAQGETEGQRDRLQLLAAELSLVKALPAVRDLELARLRKIQDLREQGIEATSEQGRRILANLEAEMGFERVLERQQRARDALVDAGEDAFDSFGELVARGETSWSAWRDAGLDAVADVTADLMKLGIINPIKNKLFGQDNETLQDLFGKGAEGAADAAKKTAESAALASAGTAAATAISTGMTGAGSSASVAMGGAITTAGGTAALEIGAAMLAAGTEVALMMAASGGGGFGGFGGGGGGAGGGMSPPVTYAAAGTEYAPGGLTWVGEQGPELLRLKRGATVYDNARSMRMATAATQPAGGAGGVPRITINNLGAPVDVRARQDSDGSLKIELRAFKRGLMAEAGASGDLAAGLRRTPRMTSRP